MTVTWGSRYWTWYLIVAALGFLVPEIYALFTNTKNTLTDYSRNELHVVPGEAFAAHNAAWLLTQGAYVLVVGWLLFHIWYDLFS